MDYDGHTLKQKRFLLNSTGTVGKIYSLILGGFQIEIKGKIRYLLICCNLICTRQNYDKNILVIGNPLMILELGPVSNGRSDNFTFCGGIHEFLNSPFFEKITDFSILCCCCHFTENSVKWQPLTLLC